MFCCGNKGTHYARSVLPVAHVKYLRYPMIFSQILRVVEIC